MRNFLTGKSSFGQNRALNVTCYPVWPCVPRTLAVLLSFVWFCAELRTFAAPERIDLPLLQRSIEEFPADLPAKELTVRIPESIALEPGSQLMLRLRTTSNLPANYLGVSLFLNGRKLGARPPGALAPTAPADYVDFSFTIAARQLSAGWNRVRIEFEPAPRISNELLKNSRYVLRSPECRLNLAFSRLPMFPELARFPATFTEQKLISQAATPVASSLVILGFPDQVRPVHLRACAILGARLGQNGYLSESDYQIVRTNLRAWTPHPGNLILVCRADEILRTPLTNGFTFPPLKPGQGLLTERIRSDRQSRALLVSGADDIGIEKALLALGNSEFLASIGPQPAIITNVPPLSGAAKARLGPAALPLRFGDCDWDSSPMIGSRTERTLNGWRLPPGHFLEDGRLLLDIRHSPGLRNSAIDVLVNGARVGSVSLPLPHNSGSVRIELPEELYGQDPMQITFRAMLATPMFSSGGAPEVDIAGSSQIVGEVRRATVRDLRNASRLLVPDPSLEKLAFAVPLNCSGDELRTFFNLALYAGANVPSSPLAWPDCSAYGEKQAAEQSRLFGKTTVLLGSVSQWTTALPNGELLPVQIDPANPGTVLMQHRAYATREFEPTLTFLQLITSRWSHEDVMVAGGSWNGFATAKLAWMFTDAEASSAIFGNIAVADEHGRVVTYDTRHPSLDSLGERIRTRVPAGVSVEETDRRLAGLEKRFKKSHHLNNALFYSLGILLILLVAVRLALAHEHSRRRTKALHSEKTAATTA